MGSRAEGATETPLRLDGLALTVEDTAKLLHQGLRQTYEAARRGDIPAVKIGGRWFVKRAELYRMFGLSADPAPQPGTAAEEPAPEDASLRPHSARIPESPRDSAAPGSGI